MHRLLIFLLLLLPARSGAGTSAPQTRVSQSHILEALLKVPEVRSLDSTIGRQSGGQRGASFLFTDTPSRQRPCYRVTVGHNGPLRYETIYIFYYFPADGSIRIEDTLEGDIVSLSEYRKRQLHRP
jgi:hypothetical protein